MNPNEKIIKTIIKLIERWLKRNPKKLIVGLEGTVGIGKTSISNDVAKLCKEVSVIHMDHFMYPDKKINKLLSLSGGNPSFYIHKNWYNLKKIKGIFQDFRSGKKMFANTVKKGGKIYHREYNLNKKVLLIEGLFLQTLRGSLDKSIFLWLDKKQTTKRRKNRWKRLNKKESKESFTVFEKAWRYYLKKYNPKKNASFFIKMRVVDNFS